MVVWTSLLLSRRLGSFSECLWNCQLFHGHGKGTWWSGRKGPEPSPGTWIYYPGSVTFEQVVSLRFLRCQTLQGYCEGQLNKWARKSVRALQSITKTVSSCGDSSISRGVPYCLTLSVPLEATDCSVLTVENAILGLLRSYFCTYISHWSGFCGNISFCLFTLNHTGS